MQPATSIVLKLMAQNQEEALQLVLEKHKQIAIEVLSKRFDELYEKKVDLLVLCKGIVGLYDKINAAKTTEELARVFSA